MYFCSESSRISLELHPKKGKFMVEDTSRQSLGMTIAKNTIVVTLGSLLLKAINFLFNVYIIRRLGDNRYGQYSVVLAFVGIYQIFAELGVSQFVMRESARDRSQAEPLFWNLVAVRSLLALAAMAFMPLLAYSFQYDSQLILGVFLFACSFLLSAVLAPIQGLLTAYERFDIVTTQNVLGQVVFVLFGAAFLLSGLGFIWLIVASLISLVPQIALGVYFVLRNKLLTGKFRVQPSSWFGLIRSGLPFGIITLTLSIAFKIDTIILKGFTNDSIVGWYNAAYNLVFSLTFLTAGFKEAIVPSLARSFVTDPVQVERWYFRTVKMMVILSLPIAVGGMLIANPLITLLYSESYAPSGPALAILIWDVPFLMFASFCGNISTIISQERRAALIYGINALANVLMNLYAIPHYGLMGAAVTTVLTDLIGSVQFYFMLRGRLNLPDMRLTMIKAVAAAGLMGILIYLLRDVNLFVLIGVGMIVYTILIFVFRLFDEAEWALIMRLFRGFRQQGKQA